MIQGPLAQMMRKWSTTPVSHLEEVQNGQLIHHPMIQGWSQEEMSQRLSMIDPPRTVSRPVSDQRAP